MRRRHACVNSTGETFPARSSSEASARLSLVRRSESMPPAFRVTRAEAATAAAVLANARRDKGRIPLGERGEHLVGVPIDPDVVPAPLHNAVGADEIGRAGDTHVLLAV